MISLVPHIHAYKEPRCIIYKKEGHVDEECNIYRKVSPVTSPSQKQKKQTKSITYSHEIRKWSPPPILESKLEIMKQISDPNLVTKRTHYTCTLNSADPKIKNNSIASPIPIPFKTNPIKVYNYTNI